jgi:hypothetical protein
MRFFRIDMRSSAAPVAVVPGEIAVSALLALCVQAAGSDAPAAQAIIDAAEVSTWVDDFNRTDEETHVLAIPNQAAAAFLVANIPRFSCPERELERTYYFRWWTFRKHIVQTPDGFVITEFLPAVPWAGKYNTIDCAAGHHEREARWLSDPRIAADYEAFWLRPGGGEPRRYSFWCADAALQRLYVTGDSGQAARELPELIANFDAWADHRDANGLYWQVDDRDGMEVSIGGSGYRATINSYQFGDANAIARIAELAGKTEVARDFRQRAETIRGLVIGKLWDAQAGFFKVRPRDEHGRERPLCDTRELHGFTPWYMGLPGAEQAVAWRQLMDADGFFAPYGPTTAERRSPRFALSYQGHECQWNGPSWPFATAVTLTSLANLLNGPAQDAITRADYLALLRIYSSSQRRTREDGVVVPWIDEDLNPLSGDWLSRSRLRSWSHGTWDAGKGGIERGKDYNHSTFADLVISGLVGLRPRSDRTIEVNPLLPEGTWPWFCLDHVRYHGHWLTIVYDQHGDHFHAGKGLSLLVDGTVVATCPTLQKLIGHLP